MPLPRYQSSGAAAFDLAAAEADSIKPREVKLIKTGVIVQVPTGHFLLIAARSSTAKKNLMLANGIGIVDPDFCGPEDEILLALYNFGQNTVRVKKHERLAQGLFVKFPRISWSEVREQISGRSRGGFGSTGS